MLKIHLSLKDLGKKHLTDKITHHGYHYSYTNFLEPFRNQFFNFLEIGLGRSEDGTGNSFKLWKEYFSKANIFIMDKDHHFKNEYCQVIQGDQSQLEQLISVKNIIKYAKIIIDDGSHIPEHQILSFEYFFENLLDYGGIYIIEDIECSYWRSNESIYEYNLSSLNIIDYFKKYQHQVNAEFSQKQNKLKISSITYAQNCIIITKQILEEIEFFDREYRFKDKLPQLHYK